MPPVSLNCLRVPFQFHTVPNLANLYLAFALSVYPFAMKPHREGVAGPDAGSCGSSAVTPSDLDVDPCLWYDSKGSGGWRPIGERWLPQAGR